jgi:hypothetical protein
METPLVPDFPGIESASSSFLDEPLARLAADLGSTAFRRQVQITGVPKHLVDMANVVIAQRLE